MSSSAPRTNYTPVVVLGLAMALGPLAALSIGSRFADEETLARANAGRDGARPTPSLAEYGPSGATASTPTSAQDTTVMELLAGSGVFDTLSQAISAYGLEGKLVRNDSFTLLAPSDEAFARMPADDLKALFSSKESTSDFLDLHMLTGRFTATDLMTIGQSQTVAGNQMDVGPSARYNGHVGAGGAEVVKTNLFASNGIVHVVDRVIQ